MSDYNGWTNRETWLIKLWFEPESVDDLHYIREMLEDELEEIRSGCIKDMVSLSSVNWSELASQLENEEDL